MNEKYYVPKLESWELDNGLTVVWQPREEINTFYAEIATCLGSAHTENPATAHLLEHVVTKSSTAAFPSAEELEEYMDQHNIETGGVTGFDYTSFYGYSGPDNIEQVLTLLYERFSESLLEESAIEAEKRITLNEIQDSQDDAQEDFFDSFLKAQTKEAQSRLYNILGDEELIEELDADDLKQAYGSYNPQTSILLVTGPSWVGNEIKDVIDTVFGSLEQDEKRPKLREMTLKRSEEITVPAGNSSQSHFGLAFNEVPNDLSDELKIRILDKALGMERGLLEELRTQQGIYTIYSGYMNYPGELEGMFYVVGSVDDQEKASKTIEYLKENVQGSMLDEEQFRAAKRSVRNNLLSAYEGAYVALELVRDGFIERGEILHLDNQITGLEGLKFDAWKEFIEQHLVTEEVIVVTTAKK